MHRYKGYQGLWCGALMAAGLLSGQTDSLSERVALANKKIEVAVSQVLKTGDFNAVLKDLDSAREELEAAHTELLRLQRSDEASFAILRAGDCLRIANRTTEAVAHFKQAISELDQSGNQELKAKVWLSLERAERLGMHDHQAAAEAIRQGLLAVGQDARLWGIQVDLLGERAELELTQGELEQALITIGSAISGAEQHNNQERLWINLYSRSSIHHNLADAKRQRYVNLPFDNRKAWEACERLAGEIRNHLTEALNDTERARRIAADLRNQAFADSMAVEIDGFQALQKSFEQLVAGKKAQYDCSTIRETNVKNPMNP